MPVYYDKAKGRWRFWFNRVLGGKRTRATKLLPQGWGAARRDKFDREETARLYALASGVERPEPTIGAAVALYLEHRVPRLRNGKKVARDLAHLIDYIDGQPISRLPDVSREYIKDHPELSEGTLHNRLAYLKAAGRYAWKKHNLTAHDPTGRMEIPKPNNARVIDLPVQELERQLAAIKDEETRAVFTLAFYCGCRWVSEILPRQPGDVVRHGRHVELAIGKTKNGSPRLVPVSPKARWALRHLPFKRGEAYHRRGFHEARKGLGGLERPHDMRHVLGADVVRRTGNQRDAMAALHHLSYAASLRYTQFATDRLRDVLYGTGKKMHTSRKKKAA